MGVLRLKDALRPLAPQYDFVLIDPPPSLGQLSAMSVMAADHVVVPVPAYPPFLHLVPLTRRRLVTVPCADDRGRPVLDLD